jgi:hypothetical protein
MVTEIRAVTSIHPQRGSIERARSRYRRRQITLLRVPDSFDLPDVGVSGLVME